MSWRSWLSPAILKPLVISIGLMFVQQFSGVNAVVFNAASIFKLAGFDNAKVVSISIGLMQCVGTVLGCLAMDRAGRRILLCVSLLNAHVNLFAENPKVNGHSPSPPLPSSSMDYLSSWNWLLIKNKSIYTLTHPPSSAQTALHHMKSFRSSYLS